MTGISYPRLQNALSLDTESVHSHNISIIYYFS